MTKSIGIDADTWSEHTASTSGTDMVPKAPLQETRPPGEAVTAIDEIRPAKPDPSDATPATIRRDAASEQNVRIVVGFKSGPVRTQSASTVHARQGAVVVSTIPQVSADVVTLADRAAAIAAVANYRVDPSVAFAEIDELRYASETPNDPRFGEQWGLAVVKAPDAWSVTHGSASVKIAVLDTGVFTSHPDLQGKVVGSANFSTSPDTTDRQGHGTHVAGIIAANTGNGIGVAGMGYSSSLLVGKVLGDDGSGYASWSSQGIVWAADQGARVISMSLGGSGSCSSAEQAAIDYAWARGSILIAAAGNDGALGADAPGNCSRVVSVASTTSADVLSSFSNYGPTVTVAAPGSSILSTTNNGSYGLKSGTSMATPLVSGLAALIWSTGYGTSAQAVVDRLTQTTDAIVGTGATTRYGRVNAARAVGGSAPPVIIPPVPNDAFYAATQVGSLPFQTQQSTVGASTFTSEPNCSASWYGATVWFEWTPTTTTSVAVDTRGSTFDTVVGVYDYRLSEPAIACNDDGYTTYGPSRASFTAYAGSTYRIQVGGYHGATGTLAVRIGASYPNNYFATPSVVVPPLHHLFDTTVATREVGEPQPCGYIGATSWYAYTAPSPATLQISTAGSTFDTVVAVYSAPYGTTTSFASLTSLGCIDDVGGSPQARAELYPIAGRTYYVQVGGYSGATGQLSVDLVVAIPPANDNLTSAWPITTNSSDWVVSTSGATVETGEWSNCASVGNTVWYRWTPQTTGIATVTTYGSDFDTVLSIYAGPSSGASYSSLVFFDCNDDVPGAGNRWSSVSGGVLAGATYYIQLGGYYPTFGTSHITTNVVAMPTPTASPSSTATASRTPTSTATATPSASRTLSLQAGWNLVALGISPQQPATATSLCATLNSNGGSGTAIEVNRWQSGGWEPHVCALSGNDFPIEAARGYFVRTTRPVSYSYSGNPYGPAPTVTLATGWNLIGLPTTSGTAASLLTTIDASTGVSGTAVEVDRWQSGGWEAHVRGLPVNAFAIEAGRGYFVRLTRPAGPLPASVSNTSHPDLDASPTATATATPTRTSTSTPTASPTPTFIPSMSPTPPAEASRTPSSTPTATPTANPTTASMGGPIGLGSMPVQAQPPDAGAVSTPGNPLPTVP